MDITSFIFLGIFFVIVIASIAGMVIGSIKSLYKELNVIQDRDARRWEEHYSSLDSRLEKIISRVQILEKKIDGFEQFDGLTQIKSLDSRLYTLMSRIERLEKRSVSTNKNKQLLND